MWCQAMSNAFNLIDKLAENHSLTLDEYKILIENETVENAEYLAKKALEQRHKIYGNKVFIRGLIEISNICKNNCLYCGIRRDNTDCSRYRLTENDIYECCSEGYSLGFRTFVLQGGEDSFFTDERLCEIIRNIKHKYPDCAITLSLGERTKESYQLLFDAGADRYLLRHETANKEHYKRLHPENMSFEKRMQCLTDLKEIGYQVGCGFMVGSPFQSPLTLAQDLKFIEEFKPHMCGIGPFIAHHSTPFADCKSGTLETTLYLLSIIRLIDPKILLPATTALGTIHQSGREMGILSGANVVMPNLSPFSVRKKYELYDNKICMGDESAQSINELKSRMKKIGYDIVTDRGDYEER